MKQEWTWGAAAVAIVAAVGIATQTGTKPRETISDRRQVEHGVSSKALKKGQRGPCDDPLELLRDFLMRDIAGPAVCYEPGRRPTLEAPRGPEVLQLRFVIATLPDPLHTHFSLLFDRFIEAIQQGAQDENYDYDSSWLPWDTDEPPVSRLEDQDEAANRKARREDQPGILLFRNSNEAAFEKGLMVFVVGEESTRGVHRKQFENAVAWINSLRRQDGKAAPVAILGPTFSGSFPSLSELVPQRTLQELSAKGEDLLIYSGSASSGKSGKEFAKSNPRVDFRSFVQDDDLVLDRFCRYFGRQLGIDPHLGAEKNLQNARQDSKPQPGENNEHSTSRFGLPHLAIVSEDETAYGSYSESTNPANALKGEPTDEGNQSALAHCSGATWIYYPRDISTLRAAYQSQSMFSSASTQPTQDIPQRKSLPTDLADPAGQQHDTVRSYASNQATLSQEAHLLGIVEALRSYHSEYVVLRSSNTLDPLFLANFLRREYPEARIVVLNSDLLFQRGRDALALNGVMTLSTYPLFSLAREWANLESNHSHSHRVFPENSTEGTYIASRVLIQALSRSSDHVPGFNCRILPLEAGETEREYFAPALRCTPPEEKGKHYVPIPDYAPPFWTKSQGCTASSSSEPCRPATWLSVITRTGTWPLAALNERTIEPPDEKDSLTAKLGLGTLGTNSDKDLPWPPMPRSMKLFLVFLVAISLFHAACCWFASFTAKPAFRAHFATAGWQHRTLVLIGSYVIALLALLAGWGDGIFARVPSPANSIRIVLIIVEGVCGVCALAMILNILATRRLNRDAPHQGMATQRWYTLLSILIFFGLVAAFFVSWVYPLEGALKTASRSFAYWRSVNLTSGVSPIVPFVALTLGLYIWFWYSLHGLALFGPDRPCLPPLWSLNVKFRVVRLNGDRDEEVKLTMFSQEKAAVPAEKSATPLAGSAISVALCLFFLFWFVVWVATPEVPVRSLGARQYARIFCFWMDLYISLILSQGWQVWRTWSGLRQLLVFLDRLALRRTLGALHGFSWGSVWKMSGNVLDVRYKLVSRQIECLNHLHRSLVKAMPLEFGPQDCLDSVNESREAGFQFGQWYSTNYNEPKASGMGRFKAFQQQIAVTTGIVLTKLLIPAARNEEHSLLQVDPDDEDSKNGHKSSLPRSEDEMLRNAEELVCLTYLGFAQNLLGRIRTIVLGGISLFIAATIAVANYPFDPRPVLSGVLLLVFLAFGGIVVFAYADMHRDSTLSRVTRTNPGELGSEFWVKLVGYGAAPLLGLLTTIFPEWSGFLFSWLQPGLSSIK